MWYDREISAGSEWEHEIDTHLNTAQIPVFVSFPKRVMSGHGQGFLVLASAVFGERNPCPYASECLALRG